MMAVYNRYRVLTTEVSMDIVNKQSTANYPAIVSAYASNVNSPVSLLLSLE